MTVPVSLNNGSFQKSPIAPSKVSPNPTALKVNLDFTAGGTVVYSVDIGQLIQLKQIDQLNTLYVDNTQNAAQLVIAILSSGQNLTVEPNSQGFYPVLFGNSGAINFTMTGGAAVSGVNLINVETPYLVWGASTSISGLNFNGAGDALVADPMLLALMNTVIAGGHVSTLDVGLDAIISGGALTTKDQGLDAIISGGKLAVSDAALEAIISGGALKTADQGLDAIISGGNLFVANNGGPSGTPTTQSTITAAIPASTVLINGNAARRYIMIKAPETADLWINLRGGVAGIGATDCMKISMGITYEKSINSSYMPTSQITYYCATGGLVLASLQG